MTITIEMPIEEESAIMQKAAYEGLSIGEYTRRALREKAAPSAAPEVLSQIQDDRERARQEAKARIQSGYYVTPGLSSDGLIAERREEARREAEQEARRV